MLSIGLAATDVSLVLDVADCMLLAHVVVAEALVAREVSSDDTAARRFRRPANINEPLFIAAIITCSSMSEVIDQSIFVYEGRG